jgi:methionyl-tRNA formyltransferase
MKKNFVLLTEKKWHKDLFESLKKNSKHNWKLIDDREKFTIQNIKILKPEKIFIPHWSYRIPRNIFENFNCILFHMTDLPYGRGGSPLQNLILLGHKRTKITALKVSDEIDAGPIYLKKKLSLHGNAQEIFLRSSRVIFKMILKIIDSEPEPIKQKGEPTFFSRRLPKNSEIKDLGEITQLYDFIRMLDCEGYPRAFLEIKNFIFEFKNAKLKSNNELKANVRVYKKK